MASFRPSNRHTPQECAVVFASWRGFRSPLRHRTTVGSCRLGGHELWWDVDADSPGEALSLLPPFLGERTRAIPVGEVRIP